MSVKKLNKRLSVKNWSKCHCSLKMELPAVQKQVKATNEHIRSWSQHSESCSHAALSQHCHLSWSQTDISGPIVLWSQISTSQPSPFPALHDSVKDSVRYVQSWQPGAYHGHVQWQTKAAQHAVCLFVVYKLLVFLPEFTVTQTQVNFISSTIRNSVFNVPDVTVTQH